MSRIKDLTYYIASADTNGSEIESSDAFKGEITSVTRSGGEIVTNTEPAHGGDITIDEPRGQFEVTLDLAPTEDTDMDWTSFWLGEDPDEDSTLSDTAYSSSIEPEKKVLFVEARLSDDSHQTIGYNNCTVNIENDEDADDIRRNTATFVTSARGKDGSPNVVKQALDVESFDDWDSFTAS